MDSSTFYERAGGQSFFTDLVAAFYAEVLADRALRSMYPADLEPAKEHLALFLAQYWGGPATYSETRGHPRLRMRHAGFRITPLARDAWLRHMNVAVDLVGVNLLDADRAELLDYFSMAAAQLRNADA